MRNKKTQNKILQEKSEKISEDKIQDNNLIIEKKFEETKIDQGESILGEDEELKKLIEKNIKWSQVIYNQNKKIKHRITMMVVGSYIRLFLILVPIIIGLIYLPDFIDAYFSKYSGILDIENPETIKLLLNSLK